MDTSKLKNFAKSARLSLIEQVSSKLYQVLKDESAERREFPQVMAKLEEALEDKGGQVLVDQVAYTWFNRFCALRFMDANGYNRLSVISPAEGQVQPEILAEAKAGHIDETIVRNPQTRERVLGLLNGSINSRDAQAEAYRLLIVAVCNHYNTSMPFLFEQIQDFTELLMPDDLLSDNSILDATRQAMTSEQCENVEVIGWLYQFYISEKKDDVFVALKKGKKITPENIPAATQLFTPHWIVRYLVENSLGRLWMLNHPESRLIDQMDYYIKPEEPETDFLKIDKPEDIKLSDPACGSGHMLTYAFDLMYAIYEEQGYSPTEIPEKILTHNLFGIEIDPRAGALAAFALTMKAREKYRRFLTGNKAVQPNICVLENISFEADELSSYMDKVGRDLFSNKLQEMLGQWEEADNFGSLIRPAVTDVSEVMELLKVREMDQDLLLAPVHQKVLKALRQADYLSPKYHVVVANPPYMKNSQMGSKLKRFIDKSYNFGRANLCAAFLEGVFSLPQRKALVGMILLHGWMFTSRYKNLREKLMGEHGFTTVAHFGPNAFDTISGEVVQTMAFVGNAGSNFTSACSFVDCRSGKDEAEKEQLLRNGPRIQKVVEAFRRLPDSPMAYWASEEAIDCFQHPLLEESADLREGMATGDNPTFVRLWPEVSFDRLHFSASSSEDFWQQEKAAWVPLKSGGSYRKWYGNNEKVLKYDKEAYNQLRQQGNRCASESRYFLESLTWSDIGGTASFGVRFCDSGYVFTTVGHSLFAEELLGKCAFLCSKVASLLAGFLNPTMHANPGDIERLPFIANTSIEASQSVGELVHIARNDWDSSESSWNFSVLPLLKRDNNTLKDAFLNQRNRWRENTRRVLELETNNNELFVEAYQLTGVVDSEVAISEVTLTCNPNYRYGSDKSEWELESLLLADTMREFISYAVGCMLGRYSLDKPGLILANQGDTIENYYAQVPEPSFRPDEENVIPLLDGDWFTDDISERFKKFLKVTFGTEHFDENLTFLENALYPDNLNGKKRKTIRDYFLKEFYNNHVKLYKKRPIYWLFSSPKGTFSALIYMHRYRPDTVSVVLNKYLREFQIKLQAKKESLEQISINASASAREKTQALKEISKLDKMLVELKDYERDVLYPLATQNIEIDLDDGVKVNYPKFGKALKKVTGLS